MKEPLPTRWEVMSNARQRIVPPLSVQGVIMTEDFNKWWDSDGIAEENSYREGSPVFWAWEGWQAAVKAEREACAALCFQMWDEWMDEGDKSEFSRPDAEDCARAIRARGQG